MKVLVSKDRVLSQAYEEFERCTQDQEVRELAYARERFQLDLRSSLKVARQDGFEEGQKESLRETALRMQAKGLAPDLIESITGIPPDTV